jgi:hypothetical protein
MGSMQTHLHILVTGIGDNPSTLAEGRCRAKNTSPDPSRIFGPFPVPQHTFPAKDVCHFPPVPVIAICPNLSLVPMFARQLTSDVRLQ